MSSFEEELAAVWPDELELTQADVEAVEGLAFSIHRLVETLGPLRTGYVLTMVGKKIGDVT